MTTDADPIDERIARMAPLAIPDDYSRWVAHWLDVLDGHAKTFNAVPLPDDVEPAAVFRA